MKLCSYACCALLFVAGCGVVLGSPLLNSTASASFDAFVEAHGGDYDHRHCFGPSGSDVCLFWTIDRDVEEIELAVTSGARGWVGFGISEAGGMPGSDMMVFDTTADAEVQDYFAMNYARPTLDACASDWKLQGETVVDAEEGFLAVRVTRALDTGDAQDVALLDDGDIFFTPATAIIAAWGANEDEGMNYHGRDRVARSLVRFFQASATSTTRSTELEGDAQVQASTADPKALLLEVSDGSILVKETDYPIPQVETTYYSPCWNASDYFTAEQMEQGIYLIGAEYVASKDNGGMDTTVYLHHMGAQAGFSPCNPAPGGRNNQDIYYSWAPGGQPLAYPPSAGLKVGGGDGLVSFGMNIHYDNPNEVPDLVDSTGIRWYYVNEPREHEVGQVMFGDAVVALRGQSVGAGPSGHQLVCPGSCSQTLFDGPVTFFSEGLHEHESGVRVVNEVLRDGEVINRAAIEIFDFRQNGIQPTRQQPFQVLPGDSFRTTCYYNNPNNLTTFGFGTREEMCQSLVLYYPANHRNKGYCAPADYLGNCTATYERLETDDSYDRVFGVAPATCPSDNTNSGDSDDAAESASSSNLALSSILVLAGLTQFFA